jgi:hypothetical protein
MGYGGLAMYLAGGKRGKTVVSFRAAASFYSLNDGKWTVLKTKRICVIYKNSVRTAL